LYIVPKLTQQAFNDIWKTRLLLQVACFSLAVRRHRLAPRNQFVVCTALVRPGRVLLTANTQSTDTRIQHQMGTRTLAWVCAARPALTAEAPGMICRWCSCCHCSCGRHTKALCQSSTACQPRCCHVRSSRWRPWECSSRLCCFWQGSCAAMPSGGTLQQRRLISQRFILSCARDTSHLTPSICLLASAAWIK
jgi:hypothetical protein